MTPASTAFHHAASHVSSVETRAARARASCSKSRCAVHDLPPVTQSSLWWKGEWLGRVLGGFRFWEVNRLDALA